MGKEVRKWRNQVVIAAVVEAATAVGVRAATVEVVKAEEVDKVLAGPAKRATLRGAVEPTPRQNTSNWWRLIAVSPLPVNTSAYK